jgi:hypothetical protein
MIDPPEIIIFFLPKRSPKKKENKQPAAQPISYMEVSSPCAVASG